MGNNWSESIVNGSDPKYTWAQTTPTQQVAWQVQKDQESKKAQMDATMKLQQAQNDEWKNRQVFTPSVTYRPIETVSVPNITSFSTSTTPSWHVSGPIQPEKSRVPAFNIIAINPAASPYTSSEPLPWQRPKYSWEY